MGAQGCKATICRRSCHLTPSDGCLSLLVSKAFGQQGQTHIAYGAGKRSLVALRAMLSQVARAAPRSRHYTILGTCSRARCRTTLSSVEHSNSSINALVHIAPQVAASTSSGALSDYAIAVKDNICTADMPTTCSSAMLAEFTSPFDATIVELLRDNGATLVGKTNCDEFGMGYARPSYGFRESTQTHCSSLNTYSVHGPVVNPFQAADASAPWEQRERRSAGGSSGGSAAAVAAGFCDA